MFSGLGIQAAIALGPTAQPVRCVRGGGGGMISSRCSDTFAALPKHTKLLVSLGALEGTLAMVPIAVALEVPPPVLHMLLENAEEHASAPSPLPQSP